jgi:large subunit ribosomal protein L15
MRLNQLAGNPGSRRNAKRIGRGIGSGKGTTGGRGDKGQKSRSGVAIKGFEGGQMPIHRRLPKRGFKSLFGKDYNEVGIGRVQAAVAAGKLPSGEPVTAAALVKAGVLRRVRDGVRLLANGEITAKLAFEIAGASAGAIAAVEAAGGSVAVTAVPKRKRLRGKERAAAKEAAASAGAAKGDGAPEGEVAKGDGAPEGGAAPQ